MSELPKCHLCPELSDPRMSLISGDDGSVYPLCDGCSPDANDVDITRVYARCREVGPAPTGLGRSRFGFRASPLPGETQVKT